MDSVPRQFMTTFLKSDRFGAIAITVGLTLGVGPDHGICDIYVDDTLWQSIDSYAATTGEDSTIVINLADEGPHLLDIRNRADKNLANTTPSGYKLRFKQLAFASGSRGYDLHLIEYSYDALARLSSAVVYAGANPSATSNIWDTYRYDRAGNRTQQIEAFGSSITSNFTYDAANRLTSISSPGYQYPTYDNAGRLTNDGTLTYTWDRAGRMLSAGTSSYAYNGLGQRISQTVGANVTQYLLDVQPGLNKVLAATTGAAVDRYVHGPMGIQAQKDSGNNWEWIASDGLGSLRSLVDNAMDVLHMQHYMPYGVPWGYPSPGQTPFGFTGEPLDGNNLVHLRARYYNPYIGVFPSLDPLEGSPMQPMSLNRYAYVQGNPVSMVDSAGLCPLTDVDPDICAKAMQVLEGTLAPWLVAEGSNAAPATGGFLAAVISNPVFWAVAVTVPVGGITASLIYQMLYPATPIFIPEIPTAPYVGPFPTQPIGPTLSPMSTQPFVPSWPVTTIVQPQMQLQPQLSPVAPPIAAPEPRTQPCPPQTDTRREVPRNLQPIVADLGPGFNEQEVLSILEARPFSKVYAIDNETGAGLAKSPVLAPFIQSGRLEVKQKNFAQFDALDFQKATEMFSIYPTPTSVPLLKLAAINHLNPFGLMYIVTENNKAFKALLGASDDPPYTGSSIAPLFSFIETREHVPHSDIIEGENGPEIGFTSSQYQRNDNDSNDLYGIRVIK